MIEAAPERSVVAAAEASEGVFVVIVGLTRLHVVARLKLYRCGVLLVAFVEPIVANVVIVPNLVAVVVVVLVAAVEAEIVSVVFLAAEIEIVAAEIEIAVVVVAAAAAVPSL